MSTPVWLISRREIIGRVRRRSFAVFTLLLCLVIIAAGVLAAVLTDDDRPEYDIGIVADTQTSEQLEASLIAVGDASDADITVIAVDDTADIERLLDDGKVDVVIDVGAGSATWQSDVDEGVAPVIRGAWQAWSMSREALAAGLQPAQIEAILATEPLTDDVLDPDDDQSLGILIGFASAVLLFMSITMFGSYVLTGVVEEKSTGVVEVLLSHVSANQLMAGKVFGIGVVALIQFSAAVFSGLIALRISGTEVPSEIWVGLPVAVAWFIGGFLLYSTLFALAGSFVSRVEDAQSAAAPITTAITAGYILVFVFGADPTGTPARVLSILPPFSPLLMPLRMVTGAASVVEVVVAAVLLALSVYAVILLAGSVYSRTLLHRGRRLGWREAIRREPDDIAIGV